MRDSQEELQLYIKLAGISVWTLIYIDILYQYYQVETPVPSPFSNIKNTSTSKYFYNQKKNIVVFKLRRQYLAEIIILIGIT